MSLSGEIELAVREGLFSRVLELLAARGTPTQAAKTLRIEALFQCGETRAAAKEAEALMSREALAPLEAARCTTVRAEELWYRGSFSKAAVMHKQALGLAEQSDDIRQICLSAATVLERTSDRKGLDHSFALTARVRKLAVRSGDSHLIVSSHLTFGRLEARRGRFDVARRHFAVARRLLIDESNVWLGAAADIDESAVLSLCGDIPGALELAERGAVQAAASGWSRGKVAASGNLAYCYVALGQFDKADLELSRTEREPFRSPSILLALADTRARAELAQGNTRRAEELLDKQTDDLRTIQRWYDIVAISTRVRALLMRAEFGPALKLAEEGLTAAESAQVDDAVVAFTFMRAEAQIGGGQVIDPTSPLSTARDGWPPATLADRRLVLSRAFAAIDDGPRANLEIGRAVRIYRSSGTIGGAPREVRSAPPDTPAPPTLDSAVALLELAGHPHILGREAFAILDGAGCCAQLALLAVGPTSARAVAVAGWTDTQAVAALAKAKPDDVTVLGVHRDETWLLLVRPGPDLDDHCTVAAVRKLVVTARTLDRYRRDEQERSALW
ncbi:MAG: hypothetical protein ABIX28_16145, partial [Vicinamibacterales bacterium]